ncbi:Protein C15B12.4, partial [Aphelenchoides avenae]
MSRADRFTVSFILLYTTVFLYSLADAKIARLKRQTVVSSNANSNGTADDVESSAAAHHWKTEDGVIGVNVSSAGNATGTGHANLTNNAYGSAGDKEIHASGDVSALGQNSKSTSDIDANIIGNNQTVTNYQQGLASGTGDTQAQANSNTFMGNGDQHGVYNGNNSQASAGATGSIGSNSEVVLSQTLTWDSILAQLVGSATAQGVYNAQANVDLGAGTQENGVEVNGLVSGDNSGGGLVNANVNGNGNMDNGNHELSGNLSGNVNGTGDTNLVGASNLQSNNSGKITGIASFGDTKINSDGETGASMNGQSNLASANGVTGNIHSDGTANGGTKNMTVNNGLKVDENGENTLAMGNGGLQGSGTQATNGTLSVDTKYNGNGDAGVVVNGDGQSAASGYNASALDINANADLAGSHGLAN